MNIGQLIKNNRKKIPLSQKDLADKLNISIQRLNNFENESRIPPLTMLGELATILDFDIDNINKNYNPNYIFDYNLFKERIYKYRVDNNLTLNELSEKIQISRQTISKWEKGESYPNINVYYNICESLKIAPSYFICKLNPNPIIKPKKWNIKFFFIFAITLLVLFLTHKILNSKTINKTSIIDSSTSTESIYLDSSSMIINDDEYQLMNNSTIELINKSTNIYSSLTIDKNIERPYTLYFNDENIEDIKFYYGELVFLPFYFDDEKFINQYQFSNGLFHNPGIYKINYENDLTLTPVYLENDKYLKEFKGEKIDDDTMLVTSILPSSNFFIIPEKYQNIKKFEIRDYKNGLSAFISNQQKLIFNGIYMDNLPRFFYFNSSSIEFINCDFNASKIEIAAFNQYNNYDTISEFITSEYFEFLYINSDQNYENFVTFNNNINYIYLDGNSHLYIDKFFIGTINNYLPTNNKKHKKYKC